MYLSKSILGSRPFQLICGVVFGATCVDNDVHESFQCIQHFQVPTLALQFVIQHVSLPRGPLKATEQRPVCAVLRYQDTAGTDRQ